MENAKKTCSFNFNGKCTIESENKSDRMCINVECCPFQNVSKQN